MKQRHINTTMNKLVICHFFIYLALGVMMISGTGIGPDSTEAAESQSRTESNCTIGMAKGETTAECHVPILNGCTVAQFPGYDEPWAEATKGGATSCQFNAEKTDWKTSIVGTCQACKTEQCTGRFTVMFNCADNVPAANPAFPKQR
ncbi:MAG: hypothetical protein OEY91_15170 [Nitrospirota bacterium]|nr:hypothetical protein [Nitrospirota bacterium]